MNDDLHTRAMERFDAIWPVVREERAQNLSDRRFATIRGAQWEGEYAFNIDRLDDDGNPVNPMPRVEMSLFQKAIRRTRGEYRSSRRSVDFRAKGGEASGANHLDGLFRNDENESPGGKSAYCDNAMDEALMGGFGGWRLRVEYEDDEDEENEHQRIRFEPIYDADQSLFFDLDAKHQDKSDARFAFLLFTMSREAFEERYPKADPTTFGGKLSWQYDWVTDDSLTLAEYFEVEDASVTRVTYERDEGGEQPARQVFDEDELDEEVEGELTQRAYLAKTGWKKKGERTIKRQRVRKYLLTGAEVLKDAEELPGRYIPLVPLYYERAYVGGIERSAGKVRPGIDATRVFNLQTSSLIRQAQGPVEETPILNPEQVDTTIANDWASRRVKDPAFLLLKALTADDGTILQAGLSDRLQVAQVQPATSALIQQTAAIIPDLMGMNDQPETVPSNTSAQAIELVNDRGDIADFLWRDNFEIAMLHTGRIYLSIAQEVYVEPGREMATLDADGGQGKVTLRDPDLTDKGEEVRSTDLTRGKFDVTVDVGAATKTRRDATVRAMAGVAQVYSTAGNTDAANAALGVAVLQMEGEGIEGYQEWIRKQGVSAGWVEPTEEEREQLEHAAQNPQPDPNMLVAQSQLILAQAEASKAETAKIEAQARMLTAQATVEKSRAEAIKALAGIDISERAQILKEVQAGEEIDQQHHERALDTLNMVQGAERHDRDMNEPREAAHGDAG